MLRKSNNFHKEGKLMADSASRTYLQASTLSLRHISSSFLNIPGFFIGLSGKSSSDCESLQSPTSPLDFNFFSNLSNPFSPKSPISERGHYKKKWDSNEIGLGIINSLVNEITDPLKKKKKETNVIFGPQVKSSKTCNFDSSLKSNSLPTNYIYSLDSENNGSKDKVSLESESYGNIGLARDSDLQCENSLAIIKMSSLPIAIGSLSARDIELSEDYTCIISHGLNPKTTHIFGDCILECPINELTDFGKREEEEEEACIEKDLNKGRESYAKRCLEKSNLH